MVESVSGRVSWDGCSFAFRRASKLGGGELRLKRRMLGKGILKMPVWLLGMHGWSALKFIRGIDEEVRISSSD